MIEQPAAFACVQMRSRGFESCVVQRPRQASERALARHYARPVSASASAFVDELLAGCLLPQRRPSEISALPELDRARLRRSVVAICDLHASWRALYGSYLTPDERLLSVMVWRRQHQKDEEMRMVWKVARGQRTAPGRANELRPGYTGSAAAGLRAADARRRATALSIGGIGMVPRNLVAFPKLSASLFPDLSRTIVGRVLARQSPDVTVLAARSTGVTSIQGLTAAATFGLNRALPVSIATAASLNAGRGARIGALPKVELPKFMRTTERGNLPWLQPYDRACGPCAVMASQKQHRAALGIGNHQHLAKIGLGPLSRHGGVASLVAQMTRPAVMLPNFAGQLRGLFEPLAGWRETWQELGQFIRRWEQKALWFLLSGLKFAVSQALGTLDEAEVEGVVLDALEAVVADGEFVPALRQAVAEASFLGESQRLHLDHMLEHAAEGEWVHAAAPLYWGLEGAFWEAAYRVNIVTPERTDVLNPNKQLAFETMVKRLGLEQEFTTFLVRSLFGTAGNPFRHGGANSGERRQVLFGVAALAGWIERFAGAPALNVLATRMSAALPAAIERTRQSSSLLGPGS